MRFHILGLPHTVTSHEFVACAYTQKVLKFATMMRARGHEIIHYGHEESQVDCDEHVTVMTNDVFDRVYGSHDWRKQFFKFDINDQCYQTFYRNTIEEIGKRKRRDDFLLAFWGYGHKAICDAHQDMIVVEPGIGYGDGHFARWRVYESYAVMHAVQGATAVTSCKQDWYHVVIPNYFDSDDFLCDQPRKDYCLFLGRVYSGKGIEVAIQATRLAGYKLIVAGQGELPPGDNSHVEFVGYADHKTRQKLLAEAKMLIAPTMYIEPFGGVVVEAHLSGTPTITTDWGAFVETNLHGHTGYRCRTMPEFVEAIQLLNKWNNKRRGRLRAWANKYTLENIAPRYEKYFQDILNVYNGKGWYENDSPMMPVDHYQLLNDNK